MNTLVKRNKELKLNYNYETNTIMTDLYEAYLRLDYEPEFLDDYTLIINNPVKFIVHFINTNKELSLNSLKKSWILLNNISSFSKVKNFIVISKSGYKKECFDVEGFAARLEDMDYVYNIINSTTAPIELLPHNHKAYKNIELMFKKHKEVAITHATGTGKSYIISKLIMNNIGKSLVICPTIEIKNQFVDLFTSLRMDLENIDCMTYSKISRLTEDELISLNYNLIVVDEFHRAGADIWGQGLSKLLKYNPNAKLFGATATPIRYLDDRRNMADELFKNNIASSLDLFESIARGILPAPKYIEAVYDISNDLNLLEEKINKSSNSLSSKEDLLEKIRKFKISWNNVNTISTIINKHYNKDVKRAIVFCKDINHMKEMSSFVQNWFESSSIYTKATVYYCYSSNGEQANDIDSFKAPVHEGEIKLLFSVDKLNEGVHIDGVNSVIFLRSTESNNILLQQIGRGLAASSGSSPIILDLVNNVKILGGYEFIKSISTATQSFNKRKNELGLLGDDLEDIDISFNIIDETKDFLKFLQESSDALLSSWDSNFEKALECKKRTGWFPGPMTPNEDPFIIKWVVRQRALNTADKLSFARKDKLIKAGFVFSFNEEKWLFMYNRLLKYKMENNLESFFRVKINDKELATWIQKQKRRNVLNQLSDNEYNLLKEAGISFNNALDDIWDYYINRLILFKEEHNHMFPSEGTDKELALFSRLQRLKYSKNQLPQDKIDLLNSINFPWESSYICLTHEKRIEDLKKYKAKYGHVNVQARCEEFNKLGEWVKRIRGLRRKNQLSKYIISELDKLDFCWEPKINAAKSSIDEVVAYIIEKKTNPSLTASKSLSDTMNKLRRKRDNGELDECFINKLDNAGFRWNPLDEIFDFRLNQLKEYFNLTGTFKISTKSGYPDAKKLSAWLNRQTYIYKASGYPKEKEIRLNEIGFYFEDFLKSKNKRLKN